MSVKQTARKSISETALAAAPSAQANYFKRHGQYHWQAAKLGWQKLWITPLATLMTLIVISIALALPTGLIVLLENVKQISQHWEKPTQISLYLKMGVPEDQVQQLLSEIQHRPDIANVQYISPEMGLKQLQQQADLEMALSTLKDNPLPGVVLVQPAASIATPAAINGLVQNLKQYNSIDDAQLDMQWLQRFYAIVTLGKRLALVLGGLLAIGVLFIIGNTINLALQKYRREIEIYKLIGATDGYVRRPFLYAGMLYGLCSSVLALILVLLILSSLHSPIQQLTTLYGGHFQLHGLDVSVTFTLLAAGILLGFIGSWLAVGRHLRAY